MISAVIIAKNEERNIKQCIESVSFCDEVIVVDDESTDETSRISKKLGAKVYKRKLKGNFSRQRNFGLKKANNRWVLFVDADEKISQELKNEIVQVVGNPTLNYVGYFLKRDDYMWERKLKHGETSKIKLLRLARKTGGAWRRKVHEIWEITGPTYILKNHLIHYPHPTLKDFVKEINHKSTLHAESLKDDGKMATLSKIIVWPSGKFIFNVFIKLGFLDGIRGFVFAFTMSFHSYLAWSKLWLSQRKI